ncbi:hypothetical protein E2C01_009679 [Portunus trituberculatus]|uniref:Uncharacterized protein n=1 Tax=Portunus trituberculatus TaxID=210409 RepID=A0A5B7D6E9_PORTR|nr:hypothetical protein [Portunus trituberculatus]
MQQNEMAALIRSWLCPPAAVPAPGMSGADWASTVATGVSTNVLMLTLTLFSDETARRYPTERAQSSLFLIFG